MAIGSIPATGLILDGEVISANERGAWIVHAEFPDGTFEEISGFKTENEASEWIATDLQAWLDRHDKAQKRHPH